MISDPATGRLLMLYHSWLPSRPGPERVMMDLVSWDSASPPWPLVYNGSGFPSVTRQPVP